MQNIITQVPQGDGGLPLKTESSESMEYEDGNSLVHLNIQGFHYVITRDQLMALPESLLLCLFPSGVFLDSMGQVITNLTPDDEVYIADFSPQSFEYIMDIYIKAFDDLINFPVDQFYHQALSKAMTEEDILHQKPAIIVLREDLDYYCVPKQSIVVEDTTGIGNDTILKEDFINNLMAQLKIAAGNYLASKVSVFEGLFSSNRLKTNAGPDGKSSLGAAEQHLMDMLCSSGFNNASTWGNRTQESGKTVISSLSLCRIENETTELFRKKYEEAVHLRHNESDSSMPVDMYELVPRPGINTKLLLFWRKPARKCWWSEDDVELEVQLNCEQIVNEDGVLRIKLAAENDPNIVKVKVPIRLHTRRVWTLELSVVGMQ